MFFPQQLLSKDYSLYYFYFKKSRTITLNVNETIRGSMIIRTWVSLTRTIGYYIVFINHATSWITSGAFTCNSFVYFTVTCYVFALRTSFQHERLFMQSSGSSTIARSCDLERSILEHDHAARLIDTWETRCILLIERIFYLTTSTSFTRY